MKPIADLVEVGRKDDAAAGLPEQMKQDSESDGGTVGRSRSTTKLVDDDLAQVRRENHVFSRLNAPAS